MIKRIFPFLDWFSGYNLTLFKADGIAGLTVALVLIPQSMAYAQLAGLPPYYGLYAAFLPPIIASLFGSSRQLATGPVAVVSLMTSASLEPLATAGSEGYIAYAILLSLMVGLFQLSLGILRLGLVVNFLSHPVVNGFTNAAAIIIASSQLSKMFGVNVDNAPHHYQTILLTVKSALHYTHWPTFFIGALALVIMVGLKRIAPKVPNVLVAVVVTTTLSWGMGFEHNTTADSKTIQSPATLQLLKAFNDANTGMKPLAEERTLTSKALEEAKKAHNPIALLDAEHKDRVIQSQIEELKDKAHLYREEIRKLLFKAAVQPDNTILYYLADQLPAGAKTDGRIWRFRIGSKALKLEKLTMTGGGEVIGDVPKGLPSLTVPRIDLNVMLHLFPYAAIISLLGFMEAISIAKAIASKTGQRIDPNQELIGQGLANIIGSISKSYPASGSFSRSAVNLQAGAITGMASVFTSLAVVIALMFFTPLLYHLPQSVLAAVIMMAVIGLINVSGFLHAWRAQWYDGFISILSFICTLWYAPHLDKGIMLGVLLCLMVFLYKNMRPVVTSLSRDQSMTLRCAVSLGLKECKYLSVIRFEGPLFFANASYLEDKISDLMLCKLTLRHILIVANGINDIDASGEETLSLLIDRVRSAGIGISFSGINETVMRVLDRTHLFSKIGTEHVFSTMESAIETIHPTIHAEDEIEACPLKVSKSAPLQIIHP
jgi:MFS superfamily sulfate permease-like transporter